MKVKSILIFIFLVIGLATLIVITIIFIQNFAGFPPSLKGSTLHADFVARVDFKSDALEKFINTLPIATTTSSFSLAIVSPEGKSIVPSPDEKFYFRTERYKYGLCIDTCSTDYVLMVNKSNGDLVGTYSTPDSFTEGDVWWSKDGTSLYIEKSNTPVGFSEFYKISIPTHP